FICFSFTSPAPSHLSPLSLHDALPISSTRYGETRDPGPKTRELHSRPLRSLGRDTQSCDAVQVGGFDAPAAVCGTVHPVSRLRRSEEHTSELQSLAYLVCRLLLEKKKK